MRTISWEALTDKLVNSGPIAKLKPSYALSCLLAWLYTLLLEVLYSLSLFCQNDLSH